MANLKAFDGWVKRNIILITLAPLFIIGTGLFAVYQDKTPDVHYVGEIKRPGYEPAPAYYQVEASSRKEWGDYWRTRWGWALAGGLLILIMTPVYIGYCEAEVKGFNWKVQAMTWLTGILLILLPFYGLVKDNAYETKLTPEQYEAAKTNIDSLFPL